MSVYLTDLDRHLLTALQDGLPLTARPYARIAAQLGVGEDDVLERLAVLQENGTISRFGVVVSHRALGYRANGMSVWDLPDARISELGRQVGALEFVSHCYRRPRRLPAWPYNLFAMVHGKSRAEVEDQVARIAELLGGAVRAHDVLYSTRILKKTGLRLVSKCSD